MQALRGTSSMERKMQAPCRQGSVQQKMQELRGRSSRIRVKGCLPERKADRRRLVSDFRIPAFFCLKIFMTWNGKVKLQKTNA